MFSKFFGLISCSHLVKTLWKVFGKREAKFERWLDKIGQICYCITIAARHLPSTIIIALQFLKKFLPKSLGKQSNAHWEMLSVPYWCDCFNVKMLTSCDKTANTTASTLPLSTTHSSFFFSLFPPWFFRPAWRSSFTLSYLPLYP